MRLFSSEEIPKAYTSLFDGTDFTLFDGQGPTVRSTEQREERLVHRRSQILHAVKRAAMAGEPVARAWTR